NAGHKHVVGPDEEADDGDSDAGHGDEFVSEDALAAEARHDFADHSHGGQNHDVHGGMRIEPEQVLKQERIATACWIKNPEIEGALEEHQKERDSEYRRAQQED